MFEVVRLALERLRRNGLDDKTLLLFQPLQDPVPDLDGLGLDSGRRREGGPRAALLNLRQVYAPSNQA